MSAKDENGNNRDEDCTMDNGCELTGTSDQFGHNIGGSTRGTDAMVTRRKEWFGHMKRGHGTEHIIVVSAKIMEGNRPRGRPRLRQGDLERSL